MGGFASNHHNGTGTALCTNYIVWHWKAFPGTMCMVTPFIKYTTENWIVENTATISTHIGFQCCMNFFESHVTAALLRCDYYSLRSLRILVINTCRAVCLNKLTRWMHCCALCYLIRIASMQACGKFSTTHILFYYKLCMLINDWINTILSFITSSFI